MTSQDVAAAGLASTAGPPSPSASPSEREVRLVLAGLPVVLTFTDRDAAAGDTAALWAHVLDGAAGRDPGAPEPLHLRFSARPDHSTPGSTTLPDGPEASYTISSVLTRAVIRALIGTRILLHAGAVDHPRHGVVLVVGPSGAGKSTATTTLGRDGHYLTDELTVLGPDLSVTAYPKPVSRVAEGPGRVKCDHGLPGLGLVPATSGPAPRLVVVLDRERGDATEDTVTGSRADRMGLVEALLVLVEQSSSLWTLPGALADLAGLLGRTGGAIRVRYREASELDDLLGASPPAPEEPWWSLDPVPGGDVLARGEVQVAPFVQAIGTEDAVLVLQEGRATTAHGLNALVWEHLLDEGPLTPEALRTALEAELGAHPDSAALIEASLGQLEGTGMIRRDA